jgi:hypothetical protein
VFSEDELHQARSVSAVEVAQRHGAKLRKEGRELVGACPRCGGVDRFAVWPNKNVWNCRGCGTGGDVIKLEMHLSGRRFFDAVRTLIGKGQAGPTPEEIVARAAREAERRRAEAEEQQRNASSVAKIVARLQPIAGTPGEAYLRDVRKIDVDHLGYQARAGGRRDARLVRADLFPAGRPRAQRPMARRHPRHPDRSGHRRADRRDHPDLPLRRRQGVPGEVAGRRWAARDPSLIAR